MCTQFKSKYNSRMRPKKIPDIRLQHDAQSLTEVRVAETQTARVAVVSNRAWSPLRVHLVPESASSLRGRTSQRRSWNAAEFIRSAGGGTLIRDCAPSLPVGFQFQERRRSRPGLITDEEDRWQISVLWLGVCADIGSPTECYLRRGHLVDPHCPLLINS